MPEFGGGGGGVGGGSDTGTGRATTAPRCFHLGNPDGLQLQLMDIGACWLSCRVPLGNGQWREVLLGHPAPADHLHEPGYLGVLVGRYANRIDQARFMLDGRLHHLLPNEGPHQLHGGPDGFHRRRWQVRDHGPRHLCLALASPDGDQGWPGHLQAEVTVRLADAGLGLRMDFGAEVDAPCPVSLSQHAYYNLDGQPAGHAGDVRGHRLRVASSQVLALRPDGIPTGALLPVQGTPMDLRAGPRLADSLGAGRPDSGPLGPTRGHDHCHVLDDAAASGLQPAAELCASDGRLRMQLYTDYPGLQVYTGNHLPPARGRDGRPLAAHAGVALEPQFFPDAPNHPGWPQGAGILRPGQRLSRHLRLVFLTD